MGYHFPIYYNFRSVARARYELVNLLAIAILAGERVSSDAFPCVRSDSMNLLIEIGASDLIP